MTVLWCELEPYHRVRYNVKWGFFHDDPIVKFGSLYKTLV